MANKKVTIPPFKIFFTIDLQGKEKKKRAKGSKSIRMTQENFEIMDKAFNELKGNK